MKTTYEVGDRVYYTAYSDADKYPGRVVSVVGGSVGIIFDHALYQTLDYAGSELDRFIHTLNPYDLDPIE